MKVRDVYPDKWLRVDDLGEKRVVVTVEAATVEALRQLVGGPKRKVVLAFVGARKRLPLNKTQAFAVADVAGTEEIEKWPGVRLALEPGLAQNGKRTIVISPVSKVQSQKSMEEDDAG